MFLDPAWNSDTEHIEKDVYYHEKWFSCLIGADLCLVSCCGLMVYMLANPKQDKIG